MQTVLEEKHLSKVNHKKYMQAKRNPFTDLVSWQRDKAMPKYRSLKASLYIKSDNVM